MAKLTDSIQERWDKLVPEQKRKISITLVILGVIACSSIGYMLSHSGKENKPTPKDLNRREIVLDQGMVEESLYAQATKGMDSTKKELDKTSGRVESLEKKMAAMETYVQGNAATLPGLAAGAVPPAPGAVGAAKAPGGVLPPGGSPLAGISGAGAIPPPPVVMPKESQRSVGSKNLGEFLAPPPPGSSSREDGPAEFKPQPSILGNIAMGSNASFGKSDEDDDTKKTPQIPKSISRRALCVRVPCRASMPQQWAMGRKIHYPSSLGSAALHFCLRVSRQTSVVATS